MEYVGAHILSYEGKTPQIEDNVFITSGVCVVGDVTLKEGCNIWYNSVLRGDVNSIVIGKNTNIQDGCVCHVSTGRSPLVVGNNVTVGHNVVLHSCTIKDNCLIGMGAILLDDVVVEEGAMIAAGAVVTPNAVVKSGELWAGTPAKKIRDVKPEEMDIIKWSAPHYVDLGKKHSF